MVSRALRAMTIHTLGPRFRGDDGFLLVNGDLRDCDTFSAAQL